MPNPCKLPLSDYFSALQDIAAVQSREIDAGVYQVASVTVPNAAVLALYTTPYTVLPAVAGKSYWVLGWAMQLNYLTAAFAAGGVLTLAPTGGSAITDAIPETFVRGSANAAYGGSMAGGAVPANTAIKLSAATANFTTGGGSLTVHVAYALM